MNGILVFKKREEPTIKYNADIPVLLGDWSDDDPYADCEKASYGEYRLVCGKRKMLYRVTGKQIKSGNTGTKVLNEWKRMEAMDVSDVYYDKFLINGTPSSDYSNLKLAIKVRLRVANGGSSTYFWLNYGGGKIKVIKGNDGNDVVPIEVDRLIVGVSGNI